MDERESVIIIFSPLGINSNGLQVFKWKIKPYERFFVATYATNKKNLLLLLAKIRECFSNGRRVVIWRPWWRGRYPAQGRVQRIKIQLLLLFYSVDGYLIHSG